jgi:hypothetical protein
MPAPGERLHGGFPGCLIAVRGSAVLLKSISQRPLPRRVIWKARSPEDAANNLAIVADNVVVVRAIRPSSILMGPAQQ